MVVASRIGFLPDEIIFIEDAILRTRMDGKFPILTDTHKMSNFVHYADLMLWGSANIELLNLTTSGVL